MSEDEMIQKIARLRSPNQPIDTFAKLRLKTCPMCGARADILQELATTKYFVRCTGCGMKTETKTYINFVIDAWNVRKQCGS